jgi:tRNA pseudouridine38-40 synthase
MNNVKNIMLVLEFDGTRYSGWQKQDNAITVSNVVTAALERISGGSIDLIGCSRTDAGVHAFNFICNFKADTSIPPDRMCYVLNTELPNDIVCKHSEEVPETFHSRFSAVSKRYIYLIQNTRFASAIYRNLHYNFPDPLDTDLMRQATAHIVGEHDFRAFMASGSRIADTVRTIYSLDIVRDGDIIEINISGDGFLYNMVRIIAGTLIDVGTMKIRPDELKNIIQSRNRKNAGRTVPAHGLYLAEVGYVK